ncbi:hypothetical protein KM043_002912 [Ampulex compressa]|nr:hypothetical protein KM043_002912 [Ampulex compressa]
MPRRSREEIPKAWVNEARGVEKLGQPPPGTFSIPDEGRGRWSRSCPLRAPLNAVPCVLRGSGTLPSLITGLPRGVCHPAALETHTFRNLASPSSARSTFVEPSPTGTRQTSFSVQKVLFRGKKTTESLKYGTKYLGGPLKRTSSSTCRAAQKLNLSSSPHRRRRSGDENIGPDEQPIFPNGYAALLLKSPPPAPPALLRRIGVKELTGVGKMSVSCRYKPLPLLLAFSYPATSTFYLPSQPAIGS